MKVKLLSKWFDDGFLFSIEEFLISKLPSKIWTMEHKSLLVTPNID